MHNIICIKNGKEYILDRSNIDNEDYVVACAALAFHKSLIGLSELKALESLKNMDEAGGLRISRAINTYYTVFHLFVSLMLLDTNYNIKIPKHHRNGNNVDLKVSFEDLSNPSELPETWHNFGNMEQDVATMVTHNEIKKYCYALRSEKNRITDEPHQILFDNFIFVDERNPNNCIRGLYEKLCYVRDRAIYRPSNVLDRAGGYIQTSKDVRKEIESLPGYVDLFDIIKQVYKEILKKTNLIGRNIYRHFLLNFWGTHILEKKEYLIELGYSDSEIYELKFMKKFPNKDLSFSSYTIQLFELLDKKRLISDLEGIWGHFIKMTMDFNGTDEWYY